jgi:hypothetical protein
LRSSCDGGYADLAGGSRFTAGLVCGFFGGISMMLSLPPLPKIEPGTIDPKKSPTLPIAFPISLVTESIVATAPTLEVS